MYLAQGHVGTGGAQTHGLALRSPRSISRENEFKRNTNLSAFLAKRGVKISLTFYLKTIFRFLRLPSLNSKTCNSKYWPMGKNAPSFDALTKID